MFVWGLFVYRVSWPLGMRQDLMEMQTGERCLKVCKTGGGVFWEEQQSFGCRGWKESKSLKALREHRAPILSDPWASVGKHLQRVCSARSEEIMTEWGCMSARVGVEMHCPLRHWSTIPWGCAPNVESSLYTHTCTTHITTQQLHQEMNDLICLLYTHHGAAMMLIRTQHILLLSYILLFILTSVALSSLNAFKDLLSFQPRQPNDCCSSQNTPPPVLHTFKHCSPICISQPLTKNWSILELILAKNWPQRLEMIPWLRINNHNLFNWGFVYSLLYNKIVIWKNVFKYWWGILVKLHGEFQL